MEKKKIEEFVESFRKGLLKIHYLVESYERDSSCERFSDEELQTLLNVLGEMEPILYEIEERNERVHHPQERAFKFMDSWWKTIRVGRNQ